MSEPEKKEDILLSTKKQKRLERKKTKIKAFLELTKDKSMDETKTVHSGDEGPTEMSSKKPPQPTTTPTTTTTEDTAAKDIVGSVGSKEKDQLNEEEMQKLRTEIRARQKAMMQKPKLYLTLDELYTGDTNSQDLTLQSNQPALYMMDIQHLLLYALQGNLASYKPRWCRLLRPTKVHSVVLLVIDSLSFQDFVKYRESFPNLDANFSMVVEMISPYQYGMTLKEELFWVPLSCSKMWQMTEHIQKAKEEQHKVAVQQAIHTVDAFSRRSLLLNPDQLILEGYPLPFKKNSYRFTCDSYQKVTDKSPMFAIDCEMCMTTHKKAELTRISVVNENLEVLFDSYVKPFNKITDYLTQYSGITEHILRNVSTRLIDVQKFLRGLLPPDAILCGHSLNADLHALEMCHPYVIDTSVIYNLTGNRRFKSGLRLLTSRFLGRSIQDSKAGHSSVEDSMATMDLVKLKLSKSLEFGDVVMGPLTFDLPLPIDKPDDSPATKKIKLESDAHDSTSNESSKSKENDKESSEPSDKMDTNEEKTEIKQEQDDKLTPSNAGSDGGKEPLEDNPKNKAFFSKGGSSMYESFFKVLQDTKKKALLIGDEGMTDTYRDHFDVVVSPQTSDRKTVKEAEEKAKDHGFTWAQFSGAEDLDGTEDKQEILKKIDSRVHKVMQSLQENTLCMVLFAGRESEDVHNSACFVKVV